MGLDVYLYEAGTLPRDEDEDRPWTDEENAQYDKMWKETQGKSPNFPDHICGPRYLRSSYNEGGYNSVARSLGAPDMYDIFQIPEDTYEWCPTKDHLREARERAIKAVAIWEGVPDLGVSRVRDFSQFEGALPESPEEALAVYMEEKQTHVGNPLNPYNYSSRRGEFYIGEPMKVRALIHGKERSFVNQEAVLDITYMIFETDRTHYRETAKIVVEFIDTALTFIKPQINWSA